MSIRWLMRITLAVLLVGCGSSTEQPQWADAADSSGLRVLDPVTVAEGDVWRFDVGLEPYDTGEPAAPCLQPVVESRPLECIRIDADEGSSYHIGAVTRVGDERVIWQANTIDDASPVDHFVVWSNASPEGRRLDPITYRDVENLLWIIEPNEAPWGYQSVASDGTLIGYSSYVGLPAD